MCKCWRQHSIVGLNEGFDMTWKYQTKINKKTKLWGNLSVESGGKLIHTMKFSIAPGYRKAPLGFFVGFNYTFGLIGLQSHEENLPTP